jgi:hypothetical protein
MTSALMNGGLADDHRVLTNRLRNPVLEHGRRDILPPAVMMMSFCGL